MMMVPPQPTMMMVGQPMQAYGQPMQAYGQPMQTYMDTTGDGQADTVQTVDIYGNVTTSKMTTTQQ